jgi:hypothetical protein
MAAEVDVGRLYAVAPERFVAERDALARRLREEGRPEEAKRVRRVRKPPFAVWVANRLAETRLEEVRELGGAAEQLARGDAGAGERFRGALDALRRAVPEVVEEAGRRPSDATLEHVLVTLRSAAADPDARAALLAGRLAETPRPSGFEAMHGATGGRGRSRRAKPSSSRGRGGGGEAARRAVLEARARARELERRAEAAEREARRIRGRAERAAAALRKAEERARRTA